MFKICTPAVGGSSYSWFEFLAHSSLYNLCINFLRAWCQAEDEAAGRGRHTSGGAPDGGVLQGGCGWGWGKGGCCRARLLCGLRRARRRAEPGGDAQPGSIQHFFGQQVMS